MTVQLWILVLTIQLQLQAHVQLYPVVLKRNHGLATDGLLVSAEGVDY